MQHAVHTFSLNNIFPTASPQATKQQTQADEHHVHSKQARTYSEAEVCHS